MNTADERVWQALSDPVRRKILDMLRARPMTTGTLAAAFDQTRFGVMKHLSVLEAARLVLVERRGRERWNHLNAVALAEATDRWLTPFRRGWADRLGGLERYLEKENEAMTGTQGCALDIRFEKKLAAPPARVFEALTRGIGAWWVAPYRQAGAESRLSLEPEIGAPLIETGPDGHAVIWGRIEEIRVPDILYLSGRFAVVGAVAGHVRYTLEETGDGGTLLSVAHSAVGNIEEETLSRFTEGWKDLLGTRLAAHLGEAKGEGR
ncbi:MAG: metalloregulator ArsR/SmtB family transcription factor [Hyphomicrobiales bacterium]